MFRWVIRPCLFLLPPEIAHRVAMYGLRWALRVPGLSHLLRATHSPEQGFELWGLSFPNRVGLAAGFDKDGRYMHELAALGFGHIEVGTVTPRPQPGNPQPRLFRLRRDHALINRMGFNNSGVQALVERLKHKPVRCVVGVNIGKNKDTPLERATEDYVTCARAVAPYADYVVINVSSPNTPGLRALQASEALEPIIRGVQQALSDANPQRSVPLLAKVAPDTTQQERQSFVELAQRTGLQGIIATNTTVQRDELRTSPHRLAMIGQGGLSGRPLVNAALHTLKDLRATDPNLALIGVGGIEDVSTAQERIQAGAQLVQIYTGFIYQGPALVRRLTRNL